eukprot:4396977-Amphidinium_carterae.1
MEEYERDIDRVRERTGHYGFVDDWFKPCSFLQPYVRLRASRLLDVIFDGEGRDVPQTRNELKQETHCTPDEVPESQRFGDDIDVYASHLQRNAGGLLVLVKRCVTCTCDAVHWDELLASRVAVLTLID